MNIVILSLLLLGTGFTYLTLAETPWFCILAAAFFGGAVYLMMVHEHNEDLKEEQKPEEIDQYLP